MTAGSRLPNRLGVYTLIIDLNKNVRIEVGRLGFQDFRYGFYTYTGSALGKGALSLKRRVERHLSSRKKKRWHIDYLLDSRSAKVVAVVYSETNSRMECTISKYLERLDDVTVIVKDFGSSDCKSGCQSHLHHFSKNSLEELKENVVEAYKKAGLTPRMYLVQESRRTTK